MIEGRKDRTVENIEHTFIVKSHFTGFEYTETVIANDYAGALKEIKAKFPAYEIKDAVRDPRGLA